VASIKILTRLKPPVAEIERSHYRTGLHQHPKSVSMGAIVDALTPAAGLALFISVLANQAGVPVPATPSLLAAGALSSRGSLSFCVILAVVVAAALSADLVWYSLGRWRGAQTLAVLRRCSKPRAWVERVERLFLAHRFRVLLAAGSYRR
jgi:membrane protein DedA with SNARE-associated domain